MKKKVKKRAISKKSDINNRPDDIQAGIDAMYHTDPVNYSTVSRLGIKFDDEWVNDLQVSGDFPAIGYQVVDNAVEEHIM